MIGCDRFDWQSAPGQVTDYAMIDWQVRASDYHRRQWESTMIYVLRFHYFERLSFRGRQTDSKRSMDD